MSYSSFVWFLRSPLAIIFGGALTLSITVVLLSRPVEAPQVSPPAPQARVTALDAGHFRGWVGVVVSSSTVDLSTPREGVVDSVLVRVGDKVQKDQALAILSTTNLRNELAVGEAQLKRSLAEAEKSTLERQQAEERLERAKTAAAYLSADEFSVAKYQLGFASAAERSAAARIQEQRAGLEQLQERLRQSILRSPTDGVVAERYLDPGVVVAQGAVVLRVVGTGELRVRFAVPEGPTTEVSQGNVIDVSASALPSHLVGRVLQIAPTVDPASGTRLAEGALESSGQQPPYGTVVRVFPGDAR